jgi:hypothetical protein
VSAKNRFIEAEKRAAEREGARVAKRSEPRAASICHPDVPEYKIGGKLCKSCADSTRFQKRVPYWLEGEARGMAEHLLVSGQIRPAKTKVQLNAEKAASVEQSAQSMSQTEPQRGTAELLKEIVAETSGKPVKVEEETPARDDEPNLEDPKVVAFYAGAVISAGMDYRLAVRKVRPDLKSRPAHIDVFAYELEKNPSVQAEIQRQLTSLGFDEESRKRFMGILWAAALSKNPADERHTLQSWRILSKAMIENKVVVETPASLPLHDLSAGLSEMGFDEKTLKSLAAVPVSANAIPDLAAFDSDEEDESENDD